MDPLTQGLGLGRTEIREPSRAPQMQLDAHPPALLDAAGLQPALLIRRQGRPYLALQLLLPVPVGGQAQELV